MTAAGGRCARPRAALGLLVAFVLLASGVDAALAAPAPADLDLSFGDRGLVPVEGPEGPRLRTQAPAKMALGPGGEVFVLYANAVSCVGFNGCSVEWSLARFEPDGARDSEFGAPGSELTVRGNEYEPADLAVGSDGKPVVAALDQRRVMVARFDRQGRLEAMLGAGDGNSLYGGTYTPPVVTVQSDGKVVVAVGVGEKLRVVRYLPSGARDAGFGVAGEVAITLPTRSRPAGLLLDPDGTISIAAPQCCGGSPPFGEGIGFARILADGRPDPGLAGSGQVLLPTTGAEGNVEAATLAPGGGIYIVFEVSTDARSTVGHVVKLRSDGNPDRDFGKEGFSRFPMTIHSLAVDGRKRLIGGGWDGGAAISRLRPGGGLDRTFNGGSPVLLRIGGPARSIALQRRGRIVGLADEPCCGTTKSFTVFRLVGGTDHRRCLGRRATIVGTRGRDELIGTPHRDVIAALGGKDKVRGLGGPDLICGGRGRDLLFGGPGRDSVLQNPVKRRRVRKHRRHR